MFFRMRLGLLRNSDLNLLNHRRHQLTWVQGLELAKTKLIVVLINPGKLKMGEHSLIGTHTGLFGRSR